MATYIFNGECPADVKQAFIDTYKPVLQHDKLRLVFRTTEDYDTATMLLNKYDLNQPMTVNWGDGTIQQINENTTAMHQYATIGAFNVVAENINNYTTVAAYSNVSSDYTLEKIVTMPSCVTSLQFQSFMNCKALTAVSLPDSITAFQGGIFQYCNKLVNISLPNNLSSIGSSIFSNCSSLISILLPDSLGNPGSSTFKNCISLTRITFGSDLSSLGSRNPYAGCISCSIFDFRKVKAVPSLGAVSIFSDTPYNKEIIVPDELYDSWITASNWSSTTNNIVNSIVKASQSSLGPL